jgi:hypothetical protein
MKQWAIAAGVAFALASPCTAETIAAQPSFSGTTVQFAALKAYSGGTLTVVGPNGFAASVGRKGGLPALNLATAGPLVDGRYTYQLAAATSQLDASGVPQNNGRANNNFRPRKVAALSGTFLVKGGSIVAPVATNAARGGGDQDQE